MGKYTIRIWLEDTNKPTLTIRSASGCEVVDSILIIYQKNKGDRVCVPINSIKFYSIEEHKK